MATTMPAAAESWKTCYGRPIQSYIWVGSAM